MKQVGIIMGSKSDLPVMQDAIDILKDFEIDCEVKIVSAHRTPDKMFEYAKNAKENGIKVIIAGAGGAAHLPGMVASITTLPVIGVPVKSRNSIDGWDSVLSILQMPNGVPVATVALNGSKNAGILAIQIIGLSNNQIAGKLVKYKSDLKQKVDLKIEQNTQILGNENFVNQLVTRLIIDEFKTKNNIPLTADVARNINTLLVKEYMNEYRGQAA